SAAPLADGSRSGRAATAGAPARLSAFGVAAGGDIQNFGAADLARELDLYATGGADWIRIDVNWSVIQRGGPSSYDWAPFDRVVKEASARGLQVLATPLYTPAWARPSGTDPLNPPSDLARYAAFCS